MAEGIEGRRWTVPRWVRAVTGVGGTVTMVLGIVSVPDDARGWATVIDDAADSIDGNVARWVFAVVGLAMIAVAGLVMRSRAATGEVAAPVEGPPSPSILAGGGIDAGGSISAPGDVKAGVPPTSPRKMSLKNEARLRDMAQTFGRVEKMQARLRLWGELRDHVESGSALVMDVRHPHAYDSEPVAPEDLAQWIKDTEVLLSDHRQLLGEFRGSANDELHGLEAFEVRVNALSEIASRLRE